MIAEQTLNRAGARLLERFPLSRDRPVIGYACALLISVAALLMRFVAGNVMATGFPYVGFFPAVIVVTFICGTGPGILAGVLCGVFAWYFFIPPFEAFKMSPAVALTLIFYAVVVAINILVLYWMQVANARVRAERERNRELAERSNLLFRELQHRVSNNLQVVGGLLALQKREVTDQRAKQAIDEASRRLGLIGRIHRQLYDPSGEQMQLTGFLHQLAADLIDTSGKTGLAYAVEARDDIVLPADAAVPMALIVAESISNAIEHGFVGRDRGLITLGVNRRGDHVEVTIIDNGVGIPADFDPATSDSLGLRLAQMLALQLSGEFTLSGGAGTTAKLTIPF